MKEKGKIAYEKAKAQQSLSEARKLESLRKQRIELEGRVARKKLLDAEQEKIMKAKSKLENKKKKGTIFQGQGSIWD